ncbi:UNVERIFIED_CONTAM: hypothetical protein RMT77_011191 [Armadillidium vulgare]
MVLEDVKVEDTRKGASKYQNEGASVVPKSNIDSRKISELERKLADKSEKISSLEETISKRESEMAAMEERYKKYLNKAKSVIKTLDPKHNPALVPDMSVLRSQLTEKDKIIENMEKESEKSKMIREMEEKLISTAFYNYGMQMHRQMINQRLPAMNNGQSFLSRQRQASSQRTMRSNVGNSHYYDY